MPDIVNPHFAALACAVERACQSVGYTLSRGNTLSSFEQESCHIELFRCQRVDGLILDPSGTSAEYVEHPRRSVGVPTVLIDRYPECLSFDPVLLDNYRAGHMVTNYLVRNGHREIAIVIGQLEYSTAVDRLQSYLDIIEAARIERREEFIMQGMFDIESTCHATMQMLSRSHRPTAILCINNQMTIGTMKALRNEGFGVPDDISLAGIDDLPTADLFTPTLTIVMQPTLDIGQKAVKQVLARLSGKSVDLPQQFLCEATLIVRNSMRTLPRSESRSV